MWEIWPPVTRADCARQPTPGNRPTWFLPAHEGTFDAALWMVSRGAPKPILAIWSRRGVSQVGNARSNQPDGGTVRTTCMTWAKLSGRYRDWGCSAVAASTTTRATTAGSAPKLELLPELPYRERPGSRVRLNRSGYGRVLGDIRSDESRLDRDHPNAEAAHFVVD